MATDEQALAVQHIEEARLAAGIAERQLDDAIRGGSAAGLSKDDIVIASDLSRATVYRKLAAAHQVAAPDAYRHLAPALAVEQPSDGVTIALGTDSSAPPLATFTFTAQEPVLALYEGAYFKADDTFEDDTLWPIIALSLAVSDARIKVYGPRPAKGWDSPTYFGDELDQPSRLFDLLQTRLREVDRGNVVHPIVALFDYRKDVLPDVQRLLAFGHRAKVFGIVRKYSLADELAPISASVVLGRVSNHTAADDGSHLIPAVPKRAGVAYLTTRGTRSTFSLD